MFSSSEGREGRLPEQRPGPCGKRESAREPNWEHEDRAQTRYRQAKATKQGETGHRKSEPLMVPVKLGNSPKRTQWRDGAADAENRARER